MTLTGVSIGFLGLLAFLSLHIAAWQFLARERKNTLTLAIAACAGYGAAALAARVLLHVPFLVHGPVSGPVFMLLAVLYFHFYFGVDRSVSVRTLGALASSPGRRLTLTELNHFYPKEEMIGRRLDIMMEYGWLTQSEDVFRCTPKGQALARLAQLGQRIYGLEVTG